MKAFILAAGRGSRISKYIPNIPKCTVDVGGIPLIRQTAEMLLENGIDPTVIVGYRHSEVGAGSIKDLPVHLVYNPFFDVTNSIGSLWMAENAGLFTGEDCIYRQWGRLLEPGDPGFYAKAAGGSVPSCGFGPGYDGDYFFGTENGILRRYGKELTLEERDCEYTGLAVLRAPFVPVFLKRLNELIDAQCHGKWWEDAIYSLSREMEIPVKDIRGRFWAEVEFIEDYRRILDHISEKTGKRINGSIITPHNRKPGQGSEKKNIVWNMIGSFLYALSSMVLSIAVVQIAGEDAGGIFTFAFSTFGQHMFMAAYFGSGRSRSRYGAPLFLRRLSGTQAGYLPGGCSGRRRLRGDP